MSLTLVRSRSIRYRDGIFSRGRERWSRARSLLEQDLTKKKKVLVHGAKVSSVTARRDKYVNFYNGKRRGSLFKSTSFVSEDVREARMNPFI